MKILLVNDDGYESPALIPTIMSLKQVGEVFTVVPKSQQSWTSKINSRRVEDIECKQLEISNLNITTIEAFPADCANYGLYISDDLPDILISGANVGHNVGIHAFLSSGTIGAAMEGIIAGVPSIAVSVSYTKGQDLSQDNFEYALKKLHTLVNHFYENRPDNCMLLNINLHLGSDNNKYRITILDDFQFGSLFKKIGDKIKPRHYYDLPRPESNKIGTDTWARKQGYVSITGFDKLLQFIDLDIMRSWIEKL